MDEISAVAYDKAVAVVSGNAVNDALKASTEQVDIYLDWLKEPGRTASKETLDYTTYQITTLRKNIIAAVNRITARLTTALIKPEIKKPAIEQIKKILVRLFCRSCISGRKKSISVSRHAPNRRSAVMAWNCKGGQLSRTTIYLKS